MHSDQAGRYVVFRLCGSTTKLSVYGLTLTTNTGKEWAKSEWKANTILNAPIHRAVPHRTVAHAPNKAFTAPDARTSPVQVYRKSDFPTRSDTAIMVTMKFTKMHGYGNAYIYVDCTRETIGDPQQIARLISDPDTGLGSDGLMLIYPSDTARARVEMYNADGSRMKMCGNGIRCAGRFVIDQGLYAGKVLHEPSSPEELSARIQSDSNSVSNNGFSRLLARTVGVLGKSGCETIEIRELDLETDAGIRRLQAFISDGQIQLLTVDVSPVTLDLSDMDCTLEGKTAIDRQVRVDGRDYEITCISTGNLHGVVFVDDIADVNLNLEGPALECAEFYPDRANIHFVQVLTSDHLRMCIWERGSGATRACGTGACAAVIAAHVTGRAGKQCIVDQPGGRLYVDILGDSVYLTGEARVVCTGTWRETESI